MFLLASNSVFRATPLNRALPAATHRVVAKFSTDTTSHENAASSEKSSPQEILTHVNISTRQLIAGAVAVASGFAYTWKAMHDDTLAIREVVDQKHTALDGKVDQRYKELDTKIDQRYTELDTKIDQRYTALDTKIDQRYTALDTKIDQRYTALDGKVDALGQKIDNLVLVILQTRDKTPPKDDSGFFRC